ncbi:DUF1697 domain-containing protein [Gordonia jinghuaiqii]|uniref:DUF1697 domain-containing protein n=1 Tax=Gordonia jinghuaiqii TaxID=2758710 RepID=UPI00215144EF|nr:DUF1697 domain-containing protein [Gordonia jinghuaiqii]
MAAVLRIALLRFNVGGTLRISMFDLRRRYETLVAKDVGVDRECPPLFGQRTQGPSKRTGELLPFDAITEPVVSRTTFKQPGSACQFRRDFRRNARPSLPQRMFRTEHRRLAVRADRHRGSSLR